MHDQLLTLNIGPRRRHASVTSGRSSVEVGKHGVVGVADDHDGALVAIPSLHQTVGLDGDDAAVVDPFAEISLLPELLVDRMVVLGSRVDP